MNLDVSPDQIHYAKTIHNVQQVQRSLCSVNIKVKYFKKINFLTSRHKKEKMDKKKEGGGRGREMEKKIGRGRR
jgi:hypothetical protein